MKHLTPLLCMALMAGVAYAYLKPHLQTSGGFFGSKAGAGQVIQLANSRPLHNVKVIRCDADGFVVSSQEGTLKLWNRDLTPEMYNQLKNAAPEFTATPTPQSRSLLQDRSLMGGTPTPKLHRK